MRDEQLLTLEEAIRKLAALPAANLKIDRRGLLREQYFADVVVFDPATIQDHATFAEPHQYATGMDARLCQRGPGARRRGAHRGDPGTRGSRAGLDGRNS